MRKDYNEPSSWRYLLAFPKTTKAPRVVKGTKLPDWWKRRIAEGRKGMKFTEEHCGNMSKARKGRKLTPKARRNVIAAIKRRPHPSTDPGVERENIPSRQSTVGTMRAAGKLPGEDGSYEIQRGRVNVSIFKHLHETLENLSAPSLVGPSCGKAPASHPQTSTTTKNTGKAFHNLMPQLWDGDFSGVAAERSGLEETLLADPELGSQRSRRPATNRRVAKNQSG